ncbi:hypothetical protein CF326_g9424 [Tilletia indica]|nr:hypothetical protein CF326_g9424 [Tilletia indica]
MEEECSAPIIAECRHLIFSEFQRQKVQLSESGQACFYLAFRTETMRPRLSAFVSKNECSEFQADIYQALQPRDMIPAKNKCTTNTPSRRG